MFKEQSFQCSRSLNISCSLTKQWRRWELNFFSSTALTATPFQPTLQVSAVLWQLSWAYRVWRAQTGPVPSLASTQDLRVLRHSPRQHRLWEIFSVVSSFPRGAGREGRTLVAVGGAVGTAELEGGEGLRDIMRRWGKWHGNERVSEYMRYPLILAFLCSKHSLKGWVQDLNRGDGCQNVSIKNIV